MYYDDSACKYCDHNTCMYLTPRQPWAHENSMFWGRKPSVSTWKFSVLVSQPRLEHMTIQCFGIRNQVPTLAYVGSRKHFGVPNQAWAHENSVFCGPKPSVSIWKFSVLGSQGRLEHMTIQCSELPDQAWTHENSVFWVPKPGLSRWKLSVLESQTKCLRLPT